MERKAGSAGNAAYTPLFAEVGYQSEMFLSNLRKMKLKVAA